MYLKKILLLFLFCFVFIIRLYPQGQLPSQTTTRFIQRLPEINYVKDSDNPWVDGWPVAGQQITWSAHVRNWATKNYNNVDYSWFDNNIVIDSGTLSLNAGEEIVINLPWIWTFSRHEIKLQIDPQNKISDVSDSLTIYSNAISIGLYAEQSFYDYLKGLWEIWVRSEIQKWNKMLGEARYSDTPDGVYDRFRIDNLTIVPDGTITNSNIPTDSDYSVDIVRGFPASMKETIYHLITNPDIQNSFVHELGHARYLIDVYAFDISSLDSIDISENGEKIGGSEFMPSLISGLYNGVIYHKYFYTQYKGLMNTQWAYMDSYSSAALNLMKGYRAINGNYNNSVMEGYFINDIPEDNILIVKDSLGNILPGAEIKVYQSVPLSGGIQVYSKYFDDNPDITTITDQNGYADIGPEPFGYEIIHNPSIGSNACIIIRVQYKQSVGFSVLESGKFNMEYWRGNTSVGHYEIKVKLFSVTAIIENPRNICAKFSLKQNYPNPFNPSTIIQYGIPEESDVVFNIYDITGREVRTLVSASQEAGWYDVQWNGTDALGKLVGTGTYIARIQAGEYTKVIKMVYLR